MIQIIQFTFFPERNIEKGLILYDRGLLIQDSYIELTSRRTWKTKVKVRDE
jgi:hypothetical protein